MPETTKQSIGIACLFSLFFSLASPALADDTINIRNPQGKADIAHDYFVTVIRAALKRTEKDYGPAKLNITAENLTQQRSLKFLEQKKQIDLDWAGTDIEREQKLRAIRIPLNMGLLGYRLLIIRKDRIAEFDKITRPEELKSLIACQGQHWPDSDILEDNGFSVDRTIRFEFMWRMTENRRCDYFPRAITEGYGELKAYGAETLIAYDKIILAYRFPMYFFVNKQDTPLARRLEQGLEEMLSDGSLFALLENHPATTSAFPLSQYKNSLIFSLENNFLSEASRSLPDHYWLSIP
ncbi:substrate-binding periplasmic protein [Kiloniella laminariae]|uniref:substrate-binding periplasmic protein n=1 Tax=Kiloniella laminariae TaxID=454162 RepID=UPI000366E3E2|nr:hypothetical protein [Kiloniella laminariae]